MELTLKRIAKKDTYTIGNLYINGKWFCNTLEDKVRILNSKEDKVYGETAIPFGKYKVILSYSIKFNRILPELLNVPFFSGIRIHSGNTAENTLGCILVGENKVKGKLINSRITENKLVEILTKASGEEINITIE